MSPSGEIALTLSQAEALFPHGRALLRKYMRAWEAAYGALPHDSSGTKYLVLPMVALFTEAQHLKERGVRGVPRRLERILNLRAEFLDEVSAAFRKSASVQPLDGVDDLVAGLTTSLLGYVSANLCRLDEMSRRAREVERDAKERATSIRAALSPFLALPDDDLMALSGTLRALCAICRDDAAHQTALGSSALGFQPRG